VKLIITQLAEIIGETGRRANIFVLLRNLEKKKKGGLTFFSDHSRQKGRTSICYSLRGGKKEKEGLTRVLL